MPRLVPARLLDALRPDASRRPDLPAHATREARDRVAVAALIGAMAYAIFLAAAASPLQHATRIERTIDLIHDSIGLVLCLGMWGLARARRVSDRTVLRCALGAQIVLAVVISLAGPWAGFVRTAHLSSLTWVVPLIILCPLLIPAPPRTTLRVAAACALAMPVGLLILAARGLIVAGPIELLRSGLTAGVAVAIASIASRTVYGAQQQAAAARRVGSYEMVRRIGAGGMGEVWEARHLLLARPAAVKLILPDALRGPAEARDTMLARFTGEARITASLCSPHTVQLFDFGTASDDALYYAMEMLDGINLEHFVYTYGAIEARRAVHWLRQACHALGEAHARGLVHRDIKPGNLFICRYGRDLDFLKVLDFGLSRPSRADGSTLTQPGARLGTPGYMAPEQVYGAAIDGRTDLYALGCVGYWLVAGRKPFEAEDAGELLRQHVEATPRPLSELAPQVPPALEAAILACLAKQPAERPLNADALDARLAAAFEGEPWAERDARAWWEAHPPKPPAVPATSAATVQA